MCSTPYGIRGLALAIAAPLRSVSLSAQRLTASEVWHIITYSIITPTLFVLNALRHQRFGT